MGSSSSRTQIQGGTEDDKQKELPKALALHPHEETATDSDDHYRLLPAERVHQEVPPTQEIFGIAINDLLDTIREEQQRDPTIYNLVTTC